MNYYNFFHFHCISLVITFDWTRQSVIVPVNKLLNFPCAVTAMILLRAANGGQGEVALEQKTQGSWQPSQCSQCGDINNPNA